MRYLTLFVGIIIMELFFIGCQKQTQIQSFKSKSTPKEVEQPIARLEKMVPKISVRRRQELAWGEGLLSMPLYLFDTVRTFDKSSSLILMNDESEIDLGQESWIVLDPNHLEILPHRSFFRVGRLKAKTQSELWILTTAALFRLKAKGGPATMEVVVDKGKQVKATLLAGLGMYFPSSALGRIEAKKVTRMVVNQLVVFKTTLAEETFPKTPEDIIWPSSEEMAQAEKSIASQKAEKKLNLEILSPPDFYQTASEMVEILGRVKNPEAVVLVNGKRVPLDKTLRFSQQVKLFPGANQVVVRVNFENQSETLSRTLIRQDK